MGQRFAYRAEDTGLPLDKSFLSPSPRDPNYSFLSRPATLFASTKFRPSFRLGKNATWTETTKPTRNRAREDDRERSLLLASNGFDDRETRHSFASGWKRKRKRKKGEKLETALKRWSLNVGGFSFQQGERIRVESERNCHWDKTLS